MAGITSSTIECGPGLIVYNNAYFYSQENIQLKLTEEKFDIKADAFPTLQKRAKNRKYELSFKPVGEWEHLAVLFPHGNTALGSQVFNNTPLTIWANDGTKYVLSNVAVTKQPGIVAGVGFTLLGDVTFTAILKDGAVPSDSDAYLAISSDTHPGFGSFSLAAIKTPVWTRSWGSSPWDDFKVAEGGMVFDFPLELQEQKVDGLGTVNMKLAGRSANAKFTPVGLTTAQILSALGSNTVLGAAPTVNPLNCSGTGVYIRLYNAMMMDLAALNWSTKNDRIGEVTAEATQTFTAGAADPLFYVGTSAPS